MRKVITFALILCLVFAAGCGGSSAPASAAPAENAAQPAAETKSEPDLTEAPETEPEPATAEAWETVSSGVVTWTNSIGTNWARAWVEIENTGSAPLFLESTTFDLEDPDGKLVKSLSLVSGYPQVLLPGERGVYEEETTLDDGDIPEGMTVYSRLGVVPAKAGCVRLDVPEFELKDDSMMGLKMTGRAVNNTDEDQSLVYVAALLYDADDTYLGTLWTILDSDVPAGEKQGFEHSDLDQLNLSAADVDHWLVYAYPNQFQF